MKGRIFRIQRFSIHDGYGIRTTVFLKGCPLRCVWCHNPESQRFEIEIAFDETKCNMCLNCLTACEKGAIEWDEDLNKVKIDRELCDGCGICVNVCNAGALFTYGYDIEAREVIEIVERDEVFYRNSGGGVTFSGGEPYYQPEFLLEMLKLCKEKKLNTAVDTSGYASWTSIEKSLDFVDFFLFDLKDYDSERHEKFTGVGNELILSNLERLVELSELVLRIPFIPSFNFRDEKDFEGYLGLILKFDIKRVDVLPYHSLARDKYRFLGREFFNAGETVDHRKFVELLESAGIEVTVGGYF
jgi:pyruvate formate lyase activating enzyme